MTCDPLGGPDPQFGKHWTRGYLGFCYFVFLRRCIKSFQQTKPIIVSTILPFFTAYSPTMFEVVRVMKDHFNHFTGGSGLLQHHRIIAAFRKNINLHGSLVIKQSLNHELTLNCHITVIFSSTKHGCAI